MNKTFGIGLIFCLLSVAAGQYRDIEFKHVNIDDGLSQNTIYAINQDSSGFLWFGTEEGLNRYDGQQFKVFTPEYGDSTTLSHLSVFHIFMDRKSRMWLGTQWGGMNRYDPERESFIRYSSDSDSLQGQTGKSIWWMAEDEDGTLWIASVDGGLACLDTNRNTARRFRHRDDDPGSLISDLVTTLSFDSAGNLWIGTSNGLDRFNPVDSTFIHYPADPGNPNAVQDNSIYCVYSDRQKNLWIGTENGGISRYLPETDGFQSYLNDPGDETSLSCNYVYNFFEDSRGIFWIATSDGLNILNREQGPFTRFFHDPYDGSTICGDVILTIFEDAEGIVWFGTIGSGLSYYAPHARKFKVFHNTPRNPDLLTDKHVYTMFEMSDGSLWVGTFGGINILESGTDEFKTKTHIPEDSTTVSSDVIWFIYQSRDQSIWVATDNGLNRYQPETDSFQRFFHQPKNPNSLLDNSVYHIFEDNENTLWMSTGRGISRYQPEAGLWWNYPSDPGTADSPLKYGVTCMTQDQNGHYWIGTNSRGVFEMTPEQPGHLIHHNFQRKYLRAERSHDVLSLYNDGTMLWIGTYGGGLIRLDPISGIFDTYTTFSGLPSDVVYGTIRDDSGCLWMSTNNGLCRMNPDDGQFRYFNKSDGLQSNEFNAGAYHRGDSGTFYFGGINGLNAFNPLDVTLNPFSPPVKITGFSLFNQPVPIGEMDDGREILHKSILHTDTIELNYDDYVISFEFSALSFNQPERNLYAYYLEGFEKDWNYVGNRRIATYTSLPGGSYTFRVKASNDDGVWNDEGIMLNVLIHPPIWRTAPFRIFLVLAVILIILGSINFRTRYINRQKQNLKNLVQKRTEELDVINRELERERDLFIEGPIIVFQWDWNPPDQAHLRYVSPNITQLELERNAFLEGGLDLRELVFPDDSAEVQGKLKEYLSKPQGVLEQEYRIQHHDRIFWIYELTRYYPDVESDHAEIRSFLMDITEAKEIQKKLKEHQAQLVHSGRLVALGEMAAGVAHELNQPLSIIRMQAELLRLQSKNRNLMSPAQLKDFDKIMDQVDRAAKIISVMRSFSRKEGQPADPCDVNFLLNQTLIFFKEQFRAHGIQLELSLADNLPQILIDPQKLEQVIVNLMSNARYAVESRDTNRAEMKICLTTIENSFTNYVTIKVVDNGIGMNPEEKQKCMEPFFTTKEVGVGTGLGLSISHSIVREFGGSIYISSKKNQGTTVSISFPACPPDYSSHLIPEGSGKVL